MKSHRQHRELLVAAAHAHRVLTAPKGEVGQRWDRVVASFKDVGINVTAGTLRDVLKELLQEQADMLKQQQLTISDLVLTSDDLSLFQRNLYDMLHVKNQLEGASKDSKEKKREMKKTLDQRGQHSLHQQQQQTAALHLQQQHHQLPHTQHHHLQQRQQQSLRSQGQDRPQKGKIKKGKNIK